MRLFPGLAGVLSGSRGWRRLIAVVGRLLVAQKGSRDGSMAGPSRIGDILDHLAWLRLKIGSCGRDSDDRRTLEQAVLVYNAATLFEWYVTVSSPNTPEFPFLKRDQGEAKKQANRFVLLVAKSVDQIRKVLRPSAPTKAKPVATHADALEQGLDTFLSSLPTSVSAGIRPIHHRDLELPIDPAELLAERVGSLPVQSAGTGPVAKRGQGAGDPLSPLMHALRTVFALDELKKTGELLPEAHASLQDVMAGYLADALGEAAESTPRSLARRFKSLEKQVVDSITPAPSEQK